MQLIQLVFYACIVTKLQCITDPDNLQTINCITMQLCWYAPGSHMVLCLLDGIMHPVAVVVILGSLLINARHSICANDFLSRAKSRVLERFKNIIMSTLNSERQKITDSVYHQDSQHLFSNTGVCQSHQALMLIVCEHWIV